MMITSAVFNKKIEFLVEQGSLNKQHTSGDLLTHLISTYLILESWRCDDHVCFAGLFHSIYGTETYPLNTVRYDQRNRIKDQIGDEGEALVFYFSCMEKKSFYDNFSNLEMPSKLVNRFTGELINIELSTLIELAHISLANWLDQRASLPREYWFKRASEFKEMKEHLNIGAQTSLGLAYGF